MHDKNASSKVVQIASAAVFQFLLKVSNVDDDACTA